MSRARFPDYDTGKKRSSLAQLPSEGRHKGLIKGKGATPWLPHVRAHTHRSACTRMCAPFPLPCLVPAPARRLSWPNIPSREQLLKDLIRRFYIQLPACNIPLKKEKNNLFARLKRHKDNIHVCDPDCLWSRGRDCAEHVAFQLPWAARQRTALPARGRGSEPPSLQLSLSVAPLAACCQAAWHEQRPVCHSLTSVRLTYTAKTPTS